MFKSILLRKLPRKKKWGKKRALESKLKLTVKWYCLHVSGQAWGKPRKQRIKLILGVTEKKALFNWTEDEELYAEIKQHFIKGGHICLRLQNMLKHNWQMQSKGKDLQAKRQTHIKEVPSHTTAKAVLVPQRGPLTGLDTMWRQATAGARLGWTVPLDVALDTTKDTSGTFLLTWRRKGFFLEGG